MKYIKFILFCSIGLVLADENGDKDEELLHQMASTIMQNLQKDDMPNDDSRSGSPNAPLHHFHNIGKHALNNNYFNKTDKLKITVGVKGVKFVSVERNGTVVNITTAFGVAAVALYKIEEKEVSDINDISSMSEESNVEIDESLELLRNEYIDESSESKPNETCVIIGQKARFDMKLRNKKPNKKDVKINVDHGYWVWAKTNVTKFKFN